MFANCCADTVNAAMIMGGAIIVAATIAVSVLIYFSLYQHCLRTYESVSAEVDMVACNRYTASSND